MKVLIKGAGDLASGVACRLHACGMRIIMTDLPVPTAVRRTVSFSRAVYEGSAAVEGIIARRCDTLAEALSVLEAGEITVIPDPDASFRAEWRPDVVVDAILAKRNLGTRISDAPVVVALGPGFTAGRDCGCVVETRRGHDLGCCIYAGCASANTGVPGDIGGYTTERILRAPCAGIFRPEAEIGDIVEAEAVCATVDGVPVRSRIGGVVRGLLQDGVCVSEGMKTGDVDPRGDRDFCFTVSDKARSVAGGVLEAILALNHGRNQI